MSMPPPSYPGPPPGGYPPPYHQFRPAKRRPSAWWFLPGAVSLVVALACVVVAVYVGIGMFRTDNYVASDSGPQPVSLRGAGIHMLFADAAGPRPACAVSENGHRLRTTPVDTSETIDIEDVSWRPFLEFTSAGTSVEVQCVGRAGTIRVGAPAGDAQFFELGIAGLAAFGFGVLGLAGLIIVLVLFLSRPSRKVTG